MKKTIAVAITLGLSACAMPPEKAVETTKLDQIPNAKPVKPRTSNYVNITTAKKIVLDERVTINLPRIAVMDALTHPAALTNANVVALDSGVNLGMKIGVRAQNSKISDYIRHIEGTTDYTIDVVQNSDGVVLNVASTMTKSWDLAALSDMPTATTRSGFSATSNSSGGGSGAGAVGGSSSGSSSPQNTGSYQTKSASGTEIVTTREDETWNSLILDARRILGLLDEEDDSSSGSNNSQNQMMPKLEEGEDPIDFLNNYSQAIDEDMNPYFDEPWVVGNKRLGKITAYGKPSEIKRLDEHFSRLVEESQRQVHLQGAILDIKTTRGEGYGVDWDAIYQSDDESLSLSGQATQALSIVDGGSWSIAASIPFGNLSLDALLQSLREQGSVTVQSQPRLTVTNGYTAYLGSTQEFSFVSGVEFLPLTSGGDGNVASDTAITTTLSRVNVGIKIAVTPKMLDNGKILVDIVPILSSIQGFTPIKSAGEIFETPNIALQELATQVITTSGTPIYLGGLIINRVLQNAKKLPIKNQAIADALGGAKFEQENSELLIVITPQEVGA